MNGLPDPYLDRSYVEPGSHPNVFNAEHQPRQDLHWQRQHDNEEDLHYGVLQHAHAGVDLAVERGPRNQLMDQNSRTYAVGADDDGAENDLADAPGDSEDIWKIAIDFEDQPVVIPGGPRPEPHPARTTDQGADHDHGDPEDDEAEDKGPDGKLALPVGVIAVAQRIGIDVRNDHQADDDQRRHDNACHPRIEVDEHLLEAEEIPGRLGGVHGESW